MQPGWRIQQVTVCQSGSMGEHVTHGHRRARLPCHHGVALSVDPDLVVTPGGNKAINGIFKLKVTFLKQHHQRNGSNRFGHGVDSKDRIVLHGLLTFPVHQTKGTEVGGHAVPGNQHLAADNFAAVDVPTVEVCGDSFESVCRESRLARIRLRYIHVQWCLLDFTGSLIELVLMIHLPPNAVS